MFVPLSWGGKVVLAENALQLPALAASGVTLVNTVPSALTELLRLNGVPPSVKVINLAGEPLACSLVDRIYQDTAVEKVYDLYGPSETTVYSTFALRKAGEPATIGRALANERVYLLDNYRKLVPIGVPGELYIGGDGLGREYLHRPELTAEKFVPDPFAPPGSGQRLTQGGVGSGQFSNATRGFALFRVLPVVIGYPLTSAERRRMRRREFIAGLGSAAGWPLSARSQSPL